jgi:putative ABC transport system permease protein
MVKAIYKVIVAMVRHFKWLIIAMIITSAMGTSMMIGLNSSYNSFKDSSYAFLENYNYPDVTINTNLTSDIDFDQLKAIDGVDKLSGRLAFEGGLQTQDKSSLSAKYYCFTNDEIESFYFYEKNDEVNGVYVDNVFAKNNDIKLGDTISMKVEMFGSVDVEVSALITCPECLSLKQTSGSWGDNYRFGGVFIPNAFWGPKLEIYGVSVFNQVVIKSKNDTNRDEILKSATTIIGKDNITSSFTFDESNAKKTIDVNLKPLKSLSIFLPICFYAGALLVSCVFLLQMTRQYKKQLGILTAIGYTKGQLILIACLLSLSITILSSLFAILIGVLLANLTFSLFLNSLHIPIGICKLSISSTLIACLISIVISQFAALLSTTVMFNISPSQIINQAPDPAETKQNKLMGKMLSRTSAYTKINLLTLFRSKKRLLISSLCLIASIFLITASCSFHYSKEAIIDQIFELRFANDCQVVYTTFPDQDIVDEIKAIEGVNKVEVYSYYSANITFEEKSETISINGVPQNNELLRIPDENNGVINNITGFVLEKHTADNLGVKVGDYVALDGVSTLVTALSNQYVYRNSYIPITDVSLETKHSGIVLCDLASNNEIESKIYNTTYFYGITFTEELYKSSKDNFALYDIGVFICILFAVIMGLIIIFNTEQTNLLEEQRRLSILRVLGVKVSQISAWWLINLVIQLIIALAVGLSLGTLVSQLILHGMNTVSREYPFIANPRLYLITIAIILAFSLFSHFVCMLGLKKWNLAENTKSKA